MTGSGVWPNLPLAEWQDTCETLHMWTQIVGKTRLALAPMVNHWWQVPLYVSARGLTTSAIPFNGRSFQVDFDFIDHNLLVRESGGGTRGIPLIARPVAEFYREYMAVLAALGLRVKIWPVPVEVPQPIPFTEDREHASYDPEYANRFWRALSQADRLLSDFRGQFIGKSSPVHFFWGSFDLAVTRFSGRPAPEHASVPNTPDHVVREAYSHEVISAGWWPGGGPVAEPAFYTYAYPEPPRFADAPVRPEGATYSREMGEFILPYETVRTALSPDDAVLEFLESTYVAGADLGGWERAALERVPAHERERAH